MRIHLTRDSVAAGDDADAPHAETVPLPDGLDVPAALTALGLPRPRLPSIGGGRATWVVRGSDGTALAVLAQQWPRPRPLPAGQGPLARLAGADGDVRLHVEYRRQVDPEAEYGRLLG
ncbi:hypothetical protein [Streptomyces sp. CBMA156]|uniref:hypothetical protein n=1 Tax=Streptomyces sp. CBMA156 TaxID=1930280 RepID=UPI00166197BC|nr:hypothetical protein [Streptomyces sp. CBMA156]MBD0675705.1 hypothetical protein [Streptomyces sp. CBMA156]